MKKQTIQNWIVWLCILFIIFVVLPFVGELFRKFILAFFILWLICPFLAWSLRSSFIESVLTKKGYIIALGFLMTLAVLISLLFFGSHDYLRDNLGKKYLDGYSVDYSLDRDDLGRTVGNADASTSSFWGDFIIWLYQLILVALCIGIPVLTWRFAEKES